MSRDHDLDAEVTNPETKMELSTLYCNLNDAVAVDLEKLASYLTEKNADVVTFVSPATISGTSFETWVSGYAGEHGYMVVKSKTNKNGLLTMAALAKSELSEAISLDHDIRQEPPLNNAAILFSVHGIHIVVTEVDEARNAIPSDWQEQVDWMLANHKTVPIVYDPDNLAARKVEMEALIGLTIDKPALKDVNYWMWNVDMNAPSNIDMKYGKVFKLVDCYDNVDEEAYIKKHNAYFSVAEDLTADDAYFQANDMLVYAGMVDCIAVQHSVYTPSSANGTRENFLYSSDGLWNIIESINLDKSVEWGANHYPIMVTLKVEE